MAADVQIRAGNRNRGIQTLMRLTQVAPSPTSFLQLAQAQLADKRTREAEASLHKALALQSDFAPAQIGLAAVLTQSGRTEEALKFAREVQVKQPKAAVGHVLEGEIHETQKRWKQALEAYRAALARQSVGTVAISIYRARARSGDAAGALAELEAWLSKNPADRLGHHLAAMAHAEAGNFNAAARLYEGLVKRNASDAEALNGLAWTYFQLKDARALDMANAAYRLAPQSPQVQDTLGWLLTNKGETRRGVELLSLAAKGLPAHPEVRYHLAVALYKDGKYAAARNELEAVLASGSSFRGASEAKSLLAALPK
jgi:putative PEP-CTERM system TPR-repeat lipoprotein